MPPYVRQTWLNGVLGGTPINAARLEHLEDGVLNAKWDITQGDTQNDIENALLDKSIIGGAVIVGPGTYDLTTLLIIPNLVDLRGSGSAQSGGATIFRCLTAEAGIAFGEANPPTTGGVSGGFSVDGNNISDVPLFIGQSVGRSFHNIDSYDGVECNLVLEGTQNCYFEEVNLQGTSVLDGCRIDRGAATNLFAKCEFGRSRRYHIDFTHSSGGIGQDTQPDYNTFIRCILEYENDVDGEAMIHGGAGLNNSFVDCHVVSSGETGAPLTLVKLDSLIPGSFSANWMFTNCGFGFNASPAAANTVIFDIGDSTTIFLNGTIFCSLAETVFNLGSGINAGKVHLNAEVIYTECTNKTNSPTGPTSFAQPNIQRRWDDPVTIIRPPEEYAINMQEEGDTGWRWVLNANGDQYWGSGTGVVDQALQRTSATIMQFNHKLCAVDGLCVGNSAAGATPGTVTKKIEIFDPSGASLGFIPVYDAIT